LSSLIVKNLLKEAAMKKLFFKKIGMVFLIGLLLGMMQACYFPFHHHGYDGPFHHGSGPHHGFGHGPNR
jgi:hypothetical protein